MIPPTRPTAAAVPAPVARSAVGYSSGETVYTTPHAPRLKNERSAAQMNAGEVALASGPTPTLPNP